MALAFIAFHMRDYQQDTQQLPLEGHGAYFLLLQHCWTHGRIPLDDVARAAICKVSAQRYRRHLAPLVSKYFDGNGENKRATAEIAKAEKTRTRQAMAGHRGGEASVIAKKIQAMANPRSSHSSSHGEAIKNRNITTTFSVAAREGLPREGVGIPSESLQPDFQEKAREAVKRSPGIGSGELSASIQNRGWVK